MLHRLCYIDYVSFYNLDQILGVVVFLTSLLQIRICDQSIGQFGYQYWDLSKKGLQVLTYNWIDCLGAPTSGQPTVSLYWKTNLIKPAIIMSKSPRSADLTALDRIVIGVLYRKRCVQGRFMFWFLIQASTFRVYMLISLYSLIVNRIMSLCSSTDGSVS